MDHFHRSRLNHFTSDAVRRLAERRADENWVASQLSSKHTRFLPLWRLASLFTSEHSPEPVWLGASDGARLIPYAESVVLLGEMHGHLYVGVSVAADNDAIAGTLAPHGQFLDLYQVGGAMSRDHASLLAYARGLAFWHQRHLHCGSCGSPTLSADGGHVRVCTDQHCGARHFPRTDPAVIVLVHHGNRCLLARQTGWPARMFSVVAGFVEPGETLEEAVVREVGEETGLEVTDVEYRSSQPWPFPSSLMLGFRARATHSRIDLTDDELAEAHWFSRQGLVRAVDEGRLRAPNPISISYRLIEEWFDAGDEGRLQDLAEAQPRV